MKAIQSIVWPTVLLNNLAGVKRSHNSPLMGTEKHNNSIVHLQLFYLFFFGVLICKCHSSTHAFLHCPFWWRGTCQQSPS